MEKPCVGVPANSARLTLNQQLRSVSFQVVLSLQPLSLPSNVQEILEQRQVISAIPYHNSVSTITDCFLKDFLLKI